MRRVWLGVLGAALFAGLGWTAPARAVPVDFGTNAGTLVAHTDNDFVFTPATLVKGNCLAGACLALNPSKSTKLTFADSSFTLEAFSFYLVGRPAELTVTGDNGARMVFTTGEYGANAHNRVELGTLFKDVTWILFADTGRGNVRIDNVVLSKTVVAPTPDRVTGLPIPLPAPGLLLLAGLAALAAARKRAG